MHLIFFINFFFIELILIFFFFFPFFQSPNSDVVPESDVLMKDFDEIKQELSLVPPAQRIQYIQDIKHLIQGIGKVVPISLPTSKQITRGRPRGASNKKKINFVSDWAFHTLV